jgi:hypothetical protein
MVQVFGALALNIDFSGEASPKRPNSDLMIEVWLLAVGRVKEEAGVSS